MLFIHINHRKNKTGSVVKELSSANVQVISHSLDNLRLSYRFGVQCRLTRSIAFSVLTDELQRYKHPADDPSVCFSRTQL